MSKFKSGKRQSIRRTSGVTNEELEQRCERDCDVVDLISRGNVASATYALLQRYGSAVHRYCRAALRNRVLADDVHQQVFFEAFRDGARFAARSTVRVWLFGIARHRVYDAIRKQRRAPGWVPESLALEVHDPRPLAMELVDDARLRWALVASLDELDPVTRTAVVLHYQQGFTFNELANICGQKPGTLNARVVRALPRLRAAIQSRMGERDSFAA